MMRTTVPLRRFTIYKLENGEKIQISQYDRWLSVIFDQDPLTWLLRSNDLVKHDLVSPDFIIAPIDPNIKKSMFQNIIENTLEQLVKTSLFSVKPGVDNILTVTDHTVAHPVMAQLYLKLKITKSNSLRSKTWLGLVGLDNICKLRHPCNKHQGI